MTIVNIRNLFAGVGVLSVTAFAQPAVNAPHENDVAKEHIAVQRDQNSKARAQEESKAAVHGQDDGNGKIFDESRRGRDMAGVQEIYPQLDMELMLRFYDAYASDLKNEWERRCKEQPTESMEYLRRLAEHFLRLEHVRSTDQEEYDRLVVYEKLQSQVRRLSQEIRRLAQMDRSQLTPEQDAARLVNLSHAQKDLRELLAASFDDSMRRQRIEIERLEAELRDLKRLMAERRQNRLQSLRLRFQALTGLEMPDDVTEGSGIDTVAAPPADVKK